MARHRVEVHLIGQRPPSDTEVAILMGGLAHLDPVVVASGGAQLDLTVSVVAPSPDEARGYLDRALEARKGAWLSTWLYRSATPQAPGRPAGPS
jgi:hypothetical protein